jgi:hypothetical protein
MCFSTKTCAKCKIDKSVDDFYKSKRNGSRCKSCKKEDDMIWRSNNKEKDRETKNRWLSDNKDYYSKYYLENKDSITEYNKSYYMENSSEIISNSKEYYISNRDSILAIRSEYYINKKLIDKDGWNRTTSLYQKKLYKMYPFRFIHRNLLSRHLKAIESNKNGRTSDILGYTSDDLKLHLESLFKEGMTWENYGDWHVDHIKPVSKFDKDTHSSVVNSLSNLQPLWVKENLKKGCKYE